eukprot:scaffold19622_cov215-Cylindrotheca_fusiformis.AAC.5
MRDLTRRAPIRARGYSLAYQTCGPLMCNMFSIVCDTTNDAVVIDPSSHSEKEFKYLETHLESKNVKHILLTHGHPDHVSGMADAARKWPNASIHLH